MPTKILICGYSHCGTTILKSIIGHIEDVEEILEETDVINKTTSKPYILCKIPRTKPEYFGKAYENYIKIFIIRNPLYVFSSINNRLGHYNLSSYHSIDNFINVVKLFNRYKSSPLKNVYTIRYEDIFLNDYKELKNILDNIGMKYDNTIFNNKEYTNFLYKNSGIPEEKPNNKKHCAYRSWQINQPFVSNNDPSKIDLSESQRQKIINNKDILKLYPDIKTT